MCKSFFIIIIEATVPYFIQLTFYSVFAINTHIYAKSVNTVYYYICMQCFEHLNGNETEEMCLLSPCWNYKWLATS